MGPRGYTFWLQYQPGFQYRPQEIKVQFPGYCQIYLISFWISMLKGASLLSNFVISFPSSSNRNLLKFHFTSASILPFSAFEVSHLYIGAVSFPFTDILAAMGKLTP